MVVRATPPSVLPSAFARDVLRPSFAEIDFIDFWPSATALEAPSRGEIGWSAALRSSTFRSSAEAVSSRHGQSLLPISPLEGEMSGRTEGGAPEC